ncbi:MAG: carbohydrate ABC transporter permease [Dictyoglomaceae bacterium]|nr:carbohydrate ABC transporter permease [Dictyoglomaceae bacterium]
MSKSLKTIFVQLIYHALLALFGVSFILPLLWLFLSSLKTNMEVIARPPVWIPKNPQWENFIEVFKKVPYSRYYMNSLIVCSSITIFVLITSLITGYVLAKYRFRLRTPIFLLIISTLMLPFFLFAIPDYYLFYNIKFGERNLLSTIWALIIPFIVSPWGIFLTRQFILTIPDSLIDSARIDGCSELRILFQIIFPLSLPAIVTVAIVTFITQWNYLFWPLIVSTSFPKLMTLPVGMRMLSMAFDPARNQQLIFAGLFVGTIPSTILFLLLQKYYVEGMKITGLKE